MEPPAFDFEDVFDDDYLYFYGDSLSDERSEADAETIVSLLGLDPPARVLDLACGHGRIANRLAARGFTVTGLDSSDAFLERARAEAATAGVHVEYARGDMRDLSAFGGFDAVVNWFTAFGYFSDEENRAVLREIARAIVPAGTLLMEMNHRDVVLRTYQHTGITEKDGDMMIDRHRFEPLTGRNEVERIIVRGGHVRRMRYGVRMFTFPELRDWLLAAGFSDVDGLGADGSALSFESRRMIVRARRAGS